MNRLSETRSHRLLVVGGNPAAHDEFRKLLSDAGGDDRPADQPEVPRFEIDFAQSADEAAALIARHKQEGRSYAVAFVDVCPASDTERFETACQLERADGDLLVVLVSDDASATRRQVAEYAGGCDRFAVLERPLGEIRPLALALVARFKSEQTDAQTGIMNRRTFGKHLDAVWTRAGDEPAPLCCVLADIDYFKQINNRYGRRCGDEVLAALAHLLQRQTWGSDLVCRHGSDEFCVLLPDMNQQQAAEWANEVRTALKERPVYLPGGALTFTASFGVAERLADTPTPDDLLMRADEALGVAKQSGRDRVVCHASLYAGGAEDLAAIPPDAVSRMLARDVMSTPIVTLHEKSPISAAVRFFLLSRINSSPIVDDAGRLVGIVSEKDVMHFVAAENAWNTPLGDIMQTNVVSFGEETPVADILQFFSRVSLRRVVIVRGDQPTGVLSRGNLIRWFENNFAVHQAAVDPQAERRHNTAVRAHLTQVCEGLLEHSEQLLHHLIEDTGDLTAPIVDHASRMQESLTDLLALSRLSNRAGLSEASMRISR